MKTILAATLIAASAGGSGLLGLGLGYVSADGVPDLQPAQVRTVTKEVPVTKTVTKEVPVEVVKWKTKEVPVTPKACTDAIRRAEKVGLHAANFADVVSHYPPLVSQALTAGVNMDTDAAEAILDQMKVLNSRMEQINIRLTPDVQAFNEAKSSCR